MPRFLPTLLLALLLPLQALAAAPAEPRWLSDPAQAFAEARRSQRPVFLYLEARWCHWCHVMQEQTLADPAVRRALARHYVALKVDHDANPLLANRYRDYGWPALIFLAPDGSEIVKRAGYIAPQDFLRLLEAIERDPSPESLGGVAVAAAAQPSLTAEARARLLQRHELSYDTRFGGLATAQKFIDRDSVEYALAHADDPAERRKAEQTLDAAQALIDPVWGGAYQYSTGSDWQHPHYEKIMRTQAGVLRIYALAWARLQRPADLHAAQAMRDYLLGFLRDPGGGFYVSQDADLVPGEKAHDYYALDDAGRRARGLPRIDRSLYADATGQAAEALATLYEVSGDAAALQAAIAAGDWLLRERRGRDGCFRHGQRDDGQRYLGDCLAPARAFLALYRVTGERRWLQQSVAASDAIIRAFQAKPAGYLTAKAGRSPLAPLPDLAENISLVRHFNLLRHYGGRKAHGEAAHHAMRYLASERVVEDAFEEAGILLADEELGRDPLHLVVVGGKGDAAARGLYDIALRTPGGYRRLEWWDRKEGPLANADVEYPKFPRAAGYVCGNGRCSLPSFEAGKYAEAIAKLAAAK
ncbi:thioredoxin domain-containing protein [Solimonas sp. K1W22B-7]|uniref:DUF255 domain-containing protein n=1 Tax=Solimonas sp. K1W22B-7 TaxID=2303331 RepID=UPI000E332C3F|nr:DUF255 domain-containing protein [Solimonas sp. K1W22B-7]AXQ29014.1 thioredoxin domain-containing protein [Solimonas sp. K1W22B-7]